MNSEGKWFFPDKNLTTIKIALSLIVLVTSLIFLLNYNDFAFSQTGNETGLVLNGDNLMTPGSPISNQSPEGTQVPFGFVTNGKINTVINVANGKWLANGNWSIILNNGNVTTFETKMTWYNSSGTNAHTHELTNFRPTAGDMQTLPMSGPANQIIIKGVTDVGSNNRVSWFEVPTIITINDRKILSISLDDNKTNHHFGGQPLLGIVDSFIPCSDLPGPNMEILPSCSVTPVGEQGFALTNDSSAFAPSSDSLTYGGAFPDGGIPPGGIPGGGIPPGDEQTGGGGIPFGGIPPGGIPGGGIPPGDEQTGGGGIPPGDEQTGGGEMNPQCIELKIENITSNGFETDPSDYHPPSDAIDGSSSTWWSYNGKNPWAEISLNEPQSICGVSVQWNKGDERKYSFEIEVSEDGNNYEKVFEGSNKKGSIGQELYPFEEGINGKFVKLTVTSTSSKDGWASIQEIKAFGLPSDYNQTGGGGIPPGGIPPVDNQTGGPIDNQTRESS
ncbi:MAG TPA: discoidin domain-containing protein [Nitrososphaeraceae archaeon]|nr:discoidin domain-containing protein [Nitrososphaeraceae archaeon]